MRPAQALRAGRDDRDAHDRGCGHQLRILSRRLSDRDQATFSRNFFDGIYYPTLTAKPGAPYGLYVHGNSDTGGAVRAAESITKGLGWQQVHTPVSVLGAPTKDDTEACWELGATVAATIAG